MIEVSDSVVIDAPVGEVFAYLDRPENQPEFTPSLTRSETVETLPNGGKRAAYTYTMAGIDLDGHVEAAEYEPGSRVRWEMTGDLEGTIDWTFEPVEGGTRFTYEARYAMPNRVVEAVAGPFVRRYNERELGTALENLRARIEHGEGESS